MNHWPMIISGILSILGAFIFINPIHAQTEGPKASSLNWVRLEGAESCITAQRLAQKIEKLLNRPVFVAAVDAELSIEAFVERRSKSRGWEARIVVSDSKGAILGYREVSTDKEDCSALDDSLVLVIALSIDPQAAFVQLPEQLSPNEDEFTDPAADLLAELESEGKTNQKSPAVTDDSTSTQNKSEKPTPKKKTKNHEARVSSDWRYWINAGATWGAGFLPNIGTGFLLHFYMDLSWVWPMEFNLLYWLPSDTDSKMGGTGQLQVTQGSIAVCPLTFDLSGSKWVVCGGGQVSVEDATSSGFQEPNDQTQTFYQFSVEAHTRIYVPIASPFGLSLGAVLFIPIPAHKYQINVPDGKDVLLYEALPIAGRLEIAGGVKF